MCFITRRNEFKIAEKPIRVYKWLNGKHAPIRNYTYHKGLNVPESAIVESMQIKSGYGYYGGVLHCFKNACGIEFHHMITMYIPVGAQYNDEGCSGCYHEVISTALYWPKNIFERIWYYFISKKY